MPVFDSKTQIQDQSSELPFVGCFGARCSRWFLAETTILLHKSSEFTRVLLCFCFFPKLSNINEQIVGLPRQNKDWASVWVATSWYNRFVVSWCTKRWQQFRGCILLQQQLCTLKTNYFIKLWEINSFNGLLDAQMSDWTSLVLMLELIRAFLRVLTHLHVNSALESKNGPILDVIPSANNFVPNVRNH